LMVTLAFGGREFKNEPMAFKVKKG